MEFEFATAQQIIFGEGKAAAIGNYAQQMGNRALVVTGSSSPRVQTLLTSWRSLGFVGETCTVRNEPTIADVLTAVKVARVHRCDMVVAIGGGSVIDTGKAVGALLSNPGDPLDYLEVVGRGQPLSQPSAPVIAVPTTAGTGAEVTRNAVLAVPEKQVKVSLRSPTMLPRLALVDPELTYSAPPAVTASTGMDALTQCIEPYLSNQANPITDALALQGTKAAAVSLRQAYHDGADRTARSDMALASLCGGLALANAKLGAVHGFAGVIGGMFPIPHGVVCARLLPFVFEANMSALAAAGSPVLSRFDNIALVLTADERATRHDAVQWLHDLSKELQIPPLHTYGVQPAAFDEIIAKTQRSSSMKGNPIPFSDETLRRILTAAL